MYCPEKIGCRFRRCSKLGRERVAGIAGAGRYPDGDNEVVVPPGLVANLVELAAVVDGVEPDAIGFASLADRRPRLHRIVEENSRSLAEQPVDELDLLEGGDIEVTDAGFKQGFQHEWMRVAL